MGITASGRVKTAFSLWPGIVIVVITAIWKLSDSSSGTIEDVHAKLEQTS